MSLVRCPRCRDIVPSTVQDARSQDFGEFACVRRYRRCEKCMKSYKTFELTSIDLEAYALRLLEVRLEKEKRVREKEQKTQLGAVRETLSKREPLDQPDEDAGYREDLQEMSGHGVDEW